MANKPLEKTPSTWHRTGPSHAMSEKLAGLACPESDGGPALDDPSSQGAQSKYIFSAEETSLRSKKKRKEVEGIEDEDDEDDVTSERKKNPGRRKIDIEYIQDKSKRHITFSKRKAGIMKKAYELATLTGTQLLLLVVSETGIVYTFTTPNLQPIVSDDPGKSLISSCLNDGQAEIRIEQEDPEEELPANAVGTAEEHDLIAIPSNHPATSGTPGHHQQTIGKSYHPDNQAGTLPGSLASSTIPYYHESSEHLSQPYNSIFMNPSGIQNIYPNIGPQIGLSAPDGLGAIPNLQICPPGPTPFNLQENQPVFPMDGFMPVGDQSENRKIKRRRTEADLRQRAALSGQSAASSGLPSQFSFDVQHNWLGTSDPMKLGAIAGNRSAVFDAPAFNTVVSSFLLRESGNFYGPMDLESTNRNLQSHIEQNIVLFLDACDHYPVGDATLGSRKWRQELFPRKQLLADCLKFFFEEYLPLLQPIPLEGLASYSEDLQKLVQFASIFYEDPELVAAELCEIIKSTSGSYMQNLHRGIHGSTSAQVASTSPAPNNYNTRLKCAPKLKPRKGVNITLRGGRLQTVLEEYTDWCRKNKSSWSGNKPNSQVQGWFKIERVRRTFCCCSLIGEAFHEGIAAVLKIRFPASAIKLIRKEDKLELEVQNSDDGSEWNIFNYYNFELSPGDEQEEEESSMLPGEGAADSTFLQRICEQKKLSPPDAQRWISNQRLMKLYIEAGDFDDDGFESKVPPKGGKQAFRVKKPSTAGPKTSDSSQFDLEDLAHMRVLNSPH
ncbi:hypothetical protein PCASD_21204 [Puccinia coronata f. sp. avenae]|uniref:MADS-box domain-containing protein n=1 Tax=Puccinia coronata f. sp. avenae TaxID=200324 RepID=A0A2N5SAJ9_9BASI|nr:hypothetical protein PCASD_21204 [Puccinia coronata f. sp. avenae]